MFFFRPIQAQTMENLPVSINALDEWKGKPNATSVFTGTGGLGRYLDPSIAGSLLRSDGTGLRNRDMKQDRLVALNRQRLLDQRDLTMQRPVGSIEEPRTATEPSSAFKQVNWKFWARLFVICLLFATLGHLAYKMRGRWILRKTPSKKDTFESPAVPVEHTNRVTTQTPMRTPGMKACQTNSAADTAVVIQQQLSDRSELDRIVFEELKVPRSFSLVTLYAIFIAPKEFRNAIPSQERETLVSWLQSNGSVAQAQNMNDMPFSLTASLITSTDFGRAVDAPLKHWQSQQSELTISRAAFLVQAQILKERMTALIKEVFQSFICRFHGIESELKDQSPIVKNQDEKDMFYRKRAAQAYYWTWHPELQEFWSAVRRFSEAQDIRLTFFNDYKTPVYDTDFALESMLLGPPGEELENADLLRRGKVSPPPTLARMSSETQSTVLYHVTYLPAEWFPFAAFVRIGPRETSAVVAAQHQMQRMAEAHTWNGSFGAIDPGQVIQEVKKRKRPQSHETILRDMNPPNSSSAPSTHS